jgi:hypothetical protein
MRLPAPLLFVLCLLLAACPPSLGRPGGSDDDDSSIDDDDGDDDDLVDDDDDPAVEDPDDLIGRTFLLDLVNGNLTEPAGLDAIIDSQWDDTQLLMAAPPGSAFDDGVMEALLAQGDGAGGQDLAIRTTTVSGGSWANPTVQFGPVDLLEFGFTIQGVPIHLRDASFGVTFRPDGRSGTDGWMTGSFDLRALDALLSEDGEEGAGCEFLSDTLGIECQECGAPAPGPFCLDVAFDSIESVEVPGLQLVSVP